MKRAVVDALLEPSVGASELISTSFTDCNDGSSDLWVFHRHFTNLSSEELIEARKVSMQQIDQIFYSLAFHLQISAKEWQHTIYVI